MIGALLCVLPLLAAGSGVEAEIKAVEEARRRAYLAGDHAAVASMLADDFFLTNAQGVT